MIGRGYLVLTCVALMAATCAGCSTSQPAAPPTTTSTTLVSKSGLIRADPRLTDRIVLTKARVSAGITIAGTLIVTSRASTPINLNRGCRPDYLVALTSKRYRPAVVVPTSCVGEPLIIRPGINRLPVTVFTTYLVCGQPGTPSMPACLDNAPAPLPAGKYEAVLFGSGLALPAPTPVMVMLTPESTK